MNSLLIDSYYSWFALLYFCQCTSKNVYSVCMTHRYLLSRLSLKVVYLWRHVSSTAPPFILWWSNLEILIGSLHRSSPFIGELRCQAIQTEHGPYIAERTQKSSILYIVRCLWYDPTVLTNTVSYWYIFYIFAHYSRDKDVLIWCYERNFAQIKDSYFSHHLHLSSKLRGAEFT
jgi:hypothetical protein